MKENKIHLCRLYAADDFEKTIPVYWWNIRSSVVAQVLGRMD